MNFVFECLLLLLLVIVFFFFASFGWHMIDDAKVIIDEAGIEYNNRNFKAFPKEAIYWYKYHRHYECSVDVFSQSYDDMDSDSGEVFAKGLCERIGIDGRLTHKVPGRDDVKLDIAMPTHNEAIEAVLKIMALARSLSEAVGF